MTKKQLQEWLAERPAISVRQLGIEMGYSDGGRFRRWIKQPTKDGEFIPPKTVSKILPVLQKYGYL